MSFFTQWVAQVALDRDRFLGAWNALTSNGTVGVFRVAERQIVGGNRNRKSRGHRARRADSFCVCEIQGFVETL